MQERPYVKPPPKHVSERLTAFPLILRTTKETKNHISTQLSNESSS